jgi:Multiubiquitin
MERAMKSFELRLDNRTYDIADPVLTGQQLLDLANKRPSDQYLVYQLLQNGQFEGIRLDELVDLRTPGIEKFMILESDRAFFLTLDGRKIEWPASILSGRKLKELAGVDPDSHEIWQIIIGQKDILIDDQKLINLEESNDTERFFTKPHKKIVFFIDQQQCITDKEHLTVRELIVDFAKEDPTLVTLVLRKGSELCKLTDLNSVISLENGMHFVLYFNTPTPVS